METALSIRNNTNNVTAPNNNYQERKLFLYLICHDFRKINDGIKIFDKCTSGVVPQSSRLLPPYPTALSPCRRGARRQEWILRQGGQRDARTLPPSGTAAGPNHRATQRQGLFLFFKTL
jgi:hypothetical protein